MNEKTCGIVLGIVNIVLLVICGVFFLGKDKNAPEILLSNVSFVYAAETDEEILFQGVTAVDKEDGELTDAVVIEKIVTDTEKETATITYGVADSAGNVGKATCTVDMIVAEVEENLTIEDSEEALDNGQSTGEDSMRTGLEGDASAEDTEAEDLEDDAAEESEEDADTNEAEEAENADSDENTEDADAADNEDGDTEEESVDSKEQEAEALPTAGEASNRTQTVTSKQNPGRPTIVFRSQEVKVKAGQSPAWVNVIEGLHDDKDNYESLLKTLKVKGDYDKNKAGTYNITVTVTDGEGNESNAYPMKIVVEAWE